MAMKTLNLMGVFLCATVLAILLFPAARADQFDKLTYLTVHTPIEVPGAILQPGRHVMKLANLQVNRRAVMILNEDQDEVLTTFLAIPSYRLMPPDESEITLYEVPAGHPAPVKTWFYPGSTTGFEFVYPKERARVIAALSGESVPMGGEKVGN